MRVINAVLGPASHFRSGLMDAYSTEQENLSNFDQPPILLAASSEAARARAIRMIEATGVRIAGQVSVADAAERIERQASASAVWLELDRDCGGPMDELLTLVNHDVARGRYAGVVSVSSALLDPVIARLGDGPVELIVDAN